VAFAGSLLAIVMTFSDVTPSPVEVEEQVRASHWVESRLSGESIVLNINDY
jgi:hypothetical protein